MLTVARAAADAAGREGDLVAVVTAAAEAARAALDRTPEQLEVLRDAGVVDAGGRGVCVLLDALRQVVTGEPPPDRPGGGTDGTDGRDGADGTDGTDGTDGRAPRGDRAPDRATAGGPEGPAYEVMYLLDADQEAVPALRAALAPLGDSLLVAGGAPTWNVHVHVDDVGAAIEAGLAAGTPHRIRVTGLRDDVRAASRPAGSGRGVVTVVAGDGLAALSEAAGAVVVRGGPGARASTAELLDGLHRSGARDVIVLPNDADSFGVARAAADEARAEGLHVAVVPTRASVQALAALAVHDPARSFEEDVVAMTAAASHCRHGGVTVAAREAVTMAGVCREGDVLGVVDGDFALIGTDLGQVACRVADRMLSSGGELVTLVTGDSAAEGLAATVVRHLRRSRPEVDTQVHDGGQPRYPLLLGVE
jgi:DAK2 domain fusion protein YloV